uniref:CSON013804 protein n=1 Tax=Culicoides sonorensis TaxID=179676 RepID=A0A336MEF7_CULSO
MTLKSGGSQGCNTLYQLAKRGCKAVLLERAKLTSGTTWHTAGLVWRLRPNDVEIGLLASTRNTLMSLEKETGLDPGWIMNGGLFIAHSKERLNEYKRLQTLGKCFGIESHVLSPEETLKVFPLLDPNSFTSALYSPGDGVVDPNMMCTALTKAATNLGASFFENCPVEEILVDKRSTSISEIFQKRVKGVRTKYGDIKTNCIVNATGVWGRDLIERHGIYLPLIPMKHAYTISEPMPGVRGCPNVRDHDYSTYFRIQGESICMGGYENNPILLGRVEKDFEFGLYDLDYTVFDTHVKGAVEICPAFGETGIKSTICGPESFTPDHKPLMGPDPRMDGLFHNCGFNSAGMMLGGGCGEQLAEWILHGRPSAHMFAYDIRRFSDMQTKNVKWATERSHEAYAKNYSIVFPHDEPLAGRNLIHDPLHKQMIRYGAMMEERQGWERPGYFLKEGIAVVQNYDWYGAYGNSNNDSTCYEDQLKADYTFGFPEHHDLIGEEAMTCRTNVAVFNLSYFCKLFMTGKDAQKAADFIFTADLNKPTNKTVYTCALNRRGGVEADVTVTALDSGMGGLHDPIFKGRAFYIVAGGASANHTISHIKQTIREKNFTANITDVTQEIGVLSIQGPNSRKLLEKITNFDMSDHNLPPNSAGIAALQLSNGRETRNVRILRVSFVGELGYELHIPKENCTEVYESLMEAGGSFGLRNAGYRSLYSLSSEKGYHLWGYDLRSDDTPIEANLGFTCRRKGEFEGKDVIDKQLREGVTKKLAFFTLNEQIPVWGLETVYRDGQVVGHLRRGEYAYMLHKPIGQAYIRHPEGKIVDDDFITSGKYQIEVMGELHNAECHLRSPFDPKGKRITGNYEF